MLYRIHVLAHFKKETTFDSFKVHDFFISTHTHTHTHIILPADIQVDAERDAAFCNRNIKFYKTVSTFLWL